MKHGYNNSVMNHPCFWGEGYILMYIYIALAQTMHLPKELRSGGHQFHPRAFEWKPERMSDTTCHDNGPGHAIVRIVLIGKNHDTSAFSLSDVSTFSQIRRSAKKHKNNKTKMRFALSNSTIPSWNRTLFIYGLFTLQA
jgi:hypothetical protein